MKKFIALILIIIGVLPLMGAGCISIKSNKDRPELNGGVFISYDKANTWEQKAFVEKIDDEIKTISEYNVMQMWLDPQDHQTIYITTEHNGIYVSYNAGDKWDVLYDRAPRAYEMAIDPTSRNIIYMSLGNKIIKSTDGGDVWEEIYFEALSGVRVEALAIDSLNSNIVYIGASDGRILKSLDAGKTWARINEELPQGIKQIMINRNDTKVIYVGTTSSGVFRSGDGGVTWNNISLGDDKTERAQLTKDYPGIQNFKKMVFDKTQEDAIIIATDYGLLKNKNGEASWEAVRLLTLPSKIKVISLAVSPKNNQELYYGINNALYFSLDGGKNWAARSLPTSRMTQYLVVSPENTDQIYLGVYQPPPPPEKKGLLR